MSDIEADIRDALLPLRDWETATGGAPDDIVAAVRDVIKPLQDELEDLRQDAEIPTEEIGKVRQILTDAGMTKAVELHPYVVPALRGLVAERDSLAEEARHQRETAEAALKGWKAVMSERDAIVRERDRLKAALADACEQVVVADDRHAAAAIQTHQATAAVQRVRNLHTPHEFGHCAGCGISVTHPCDTLRALDGSAE